MKRFSLTPVTLGLLSCALLLGACDKEPDPAQKKSCEDFAKHLASVAQSDQGEEVPQEQVDKMVASTVETCLEGPPSEDEMKCAMAATDLDAMKACDPKAEGGEKKADEKKTDEKKTDEKKADAKKAN